MIAAMRALACRVVLPSVVVPSRLEAHRSRINAVPFKIHDWPPFGGTDSSKHRVTSLDGFVLLLRYDTNDAGGLRVR